jgi:hypothetical protein
LIDFKDGSTTADFKVRVGCAGDNFVAYAGGSERLRVDDDGKLGLGTSSPSAPLDVVAASTGWSAAIKNNAGSGTQSGLLLSAGSTSSDFALYVRSAAETSDFFAIKGNGNVGIGTTTVDDLFHVKGATPTAIIEATGGFSALTLKNSGGATKTFSIASQGSGIGLINSEQIAFKNAGGTTEFGRWDSSGRFLVGTSTARNYSGYGIAGLQNEGTAFAKSSFGLTNNQDSADGVAIMLGKTRGTAVNSNTLVQVNDNLGVIHFEGADGSLLRIAATVAAQVDGTPGAADMPGRLVFSTTADSASSPTERMRINSAGSISTFYAADGITSRSAANPGTTLYLYRGMHNGSSTTSGGTNSFIVWTNGDVVNTNNSYGALSDIKLKENIVDANSQWNDLKALQVRNYNFKEGQTHTQIGLIAQEVELVSPGLVSESPDRDEEGNDLGTVTKSVNYSVLYMKAVKALQEAIERIEVLEQRLTDAGIA